MYWGGYEYNQYLQLRRILHNDRHKRTTKEIK